MRRGEVWSYDPPAIARRLSAVIVSSDGINESNRPWLLGLFLVEDDPRDILAVPIPGGTWVDAGRVVRVYRPWLTERLTALDNDVIERVDVALRTALDL